MKERSVLLIAHRLGQLSLQWLRPQDPFRKKAVVQLVHHSGFSEEMANALIDATFSELTEKKLLSFLRAEIGDPRVLDGFRFDASRGCAVRARGPESILHIFSSNIPNASIWSFVFGMIVKSQNIGKLSSRDAGFLAIYLRSLKKTDPRLASQNRLIGSSDRRMLLSAIQKAGLVTVYGNDDSIASLRKLVPKTTPYFGYGHRFSIALYMKQALRDGQRLAKNAAQDIWMADQRGCLSPVTLYVEKGGRISPMAFAKELAHELEQLQKKEKKSPRRGIGSALAVERLRTRHLIRRLKEPDALWIESSPRGLWAVRYGEDLAPSLGSSAQIISIGGFTDLEKVFDSLRPMQKHLQCVALECAPRERTALSEKLSSFGANRICRAGAMQTPPLLWHHDGKPNVASWIQWTDLEK